MPDNKQRESYRLSPGITWIVQKSGVLVIDERSRDSEKLNYPDAIVWELLCRGHSPAKAANMLGFILGVTAQKAQEHIELCIREWLDAGWITAINFEENQLS